jgi:hypothetical protein
MNSTWFIRSEEMESIDNQQAKAFRNSAFTHGVGASAEMLCPRSERIAADLARTIMT